jgi:hypothetical protein
MGQSDATETRKSPATCACGFSGIHSLRCCRPFEWQPHGRRTHSTSLRAGLEDGATICDLYDPGKTDEPALPSCAGGCHLNAGVFSHTAHKKEQGPRLPLMNLQQPNDSYDESLARPGGHRPEPAIKSTIQHVPEIFTRAPSQGRVSSPPGRGPVTDNVWRVHLSARDNRGQRPAFSPWD